MANYHKPRNLTRHILAVKKTAILNYLLSFTYFLSLANVLFLSAEKHIFHIILLFFDFRALMDFIDREMGCGPPIQRGIKNARLLGPSYRQEEDRASRQ